MYLKQGDIAVMTICIGLVVANLYYCQPLVVLMAHDFGIATGVAARINYITMAGYASGLLFLVPLGDLMERKRQILIITGFVIISLIAAALSRSFLVMETASFCIGFFTIVPQLILPLAAHLADPARRGKVIGTIMSGLLVGILLSRTISGAIGGLYGWRAMYWIAAAICLLLVIVIAIRFPQSRPDFKGTYGELMRSLLQLLPRPVLQEACLLSALGFGTFGAFWTTMVLFMSGPPYNYNSIQIGLFGLAGAAGALAAPIAGSAGDKKDPRSMILLGIVMLLAGFVVFYFFRNSLGGMIAGILIIDFGLQCVHISNQTRVFALIPEARNRLNTLYMTAAFTGTSLGSAFGLWLWHAGGWSAFCEGEMGLMLLAAGIYAAYHKRLSRPVA